MKNLFILLIFIPISIYSQKCKYVKNEVDKFDKSEVKETQAIIIWKYIGGIRGAPSITVWGEKINNDRFLIIYYVNLANYSVKQGMELKLLTENDSIYVYPAMKDVVANSRTGSGNTYWHGKMIYQIPDDDYYDLINAQFTNLRFYIQDRYIEEDIKPKKLSMINNTLKCIE